MGQDIIDQSLGREVIQSPGIELQKLNIHWCNCSRKISPDICSSNIVYFGCYPAGVYTVCICGEGDWNHFKGVPSTGDPPSDAWIVTMYGVDDFTAVYGQHAIVLLAGRDALSGSPHVLYFGVDSLGNGLGQPLVVDIKPAIQPPGVGFATEAQAVASAQGCYITFNHPGGIIALRLDDNSYSNNCGGGFPCPSGDGIGCGNNPTPAFGISGPPAISYTLTALSCCGRITAGRYEVDFLFDSVCPYTNVTITLDTSTPTNQIMSPTSVTMDVVTGTNTVTLAFDLRNEANKSFNAKLLFSGGVDVMGNTNVLNGLSLLYDMTPNFGVHLNTGFQSAGCGQMQFLELGIDMPSASGLPCVRASGVCDLQCTVTGSGGLLASYTNLDCSAAPLLVTGGPQCSSVYPGSGALGDLSFYFATVGTPASITLTFNWTIGTVTLPPTVMCLNLDWLGGATTLC